MIRVFWGQSLNSTKCAFEQSWRFHTWLQNWPMNHLMSSSFFKNLIHSPAIWFFWKNNWLFSFGHFLTCWHLTEYLNHCNPGRDYFYISLDSLFFCCKLKSYSKTGGSDRSRIWETADYFHGGNASHLIWISSLIQKRLQMICLLRSENLLTCTW